MKFGEVPLEEALGGYLAHSMKTRRGRVRKGRMITTDIVQQLQSEGITHVVAACLDPDDVHEDEAAGQLAEALSGQGLRVSSAATGRVNLHAQTDGVVELEREMVDALNLVDERLTLATVSPSTLVKKGRLVATIKIIPYGVPRDALQACLQRVRSRIHVRQRRVHQAILIQTRLPSLKESVLDKSAQVTRSRLLEHEAQLQGQLRVPHTVPAVVEALTQVLEQSGDEVDWLLLFGASAIADRCDVIPQAVEQLGGQLIRYGMPMDPGNLLLLATLAGKTVIGLPGCARSARANGLDRVLERLSCDLPVDSPWIASLGVGGLMHEIADRPQPRETASSRGSIAALVLAAGSSKRFGSDNKLLTRSAGKPLLGSVLNSLEQSMLQDILLVTGHDADAVCRLCDEHQRHSEKTITRLHNARHDSGMASSLICGISECSDRGVDAVLVCLADMPLIDAELIDVLVSAWRNQPGKSLYIPVFSGQRGNPVIIDASLFDSVLRLEGDVGARVLARQFPDSVQEVRCDSHAVLLDVDTPEDLAALHSPAREDENGAASA